VPLIASVSVLKEGIVSGVSGAKTMRALILLLGLASWSAWAVDSVGITRDPGYPSLGSDAVATRLVIAHDSDGHLGHAAATDAFFASVRQVLAEEPVPDACCTRATDAPFVEIDISLDGKTYELTMTSSGEGLVMSIDPNPGERRVAEVMERVLRLAEEWNKNSAR
jgi:hypothetical protein